MDVDYEMILVGIAKVLLVVAVPYVTVYLVLELQERVGFEGKSVWGALCLGAVTLSVLVSVYLMGYFRILH